ncbi:MAG: hypothetical protein WAK93_09425 [Solirubrobacteraceae bacterium]
MTTVRPSDAGARSAGQPELPSPISEATARLLGSLGIAAIAVIHILDAPGTYQSPGTRYIFWLYMAVIVGAIPVIGLLLHWPSRLAWAAAAALALGPLVGYVVSRSIGLPGDPDDVGNWLDTLGMVSLFVEVSVLGLSLTRLALYERASSAG